MVKLEIDKSVESKPVVRNTSKVIDKYSSTPVNMQPQQLQQPLYDIQDIVATSVKAALRASKEEDDELAALPQGARDFVNAAKGVESVKSLFKSPASTAVENTMSTVMDGILTNALGNMVNPQRAASEPLLHKLASILVNNASQQLPQILDSASAILGRERVQKGFDLGMQRIENQQQQQKSWPAQVIELDENNQEHIAFYAQHEGYSDIYRAQTALINHKNLLYDEIEEYQNLQKGKLTQQEGGQKLQQSKVQQNEVQNVEIQQQEVQEYNEQEYNEQDNIQEEYDIVEQQYNNEQIIKNNEQIIKNNVKELSIIKPKRAKNFKLIIDNENTKNNNEINNKQIDDIIILDNEIEDIEKELKDK